MTATQTAILIWKNVPLANVVPTQPRRAPTRRAPTHRAPTRPDPGQAATVSGYSREGMHEIRTPKKWHLWV